MKYRDPETGEFKELYTKAADTLPVGTVVDFDGDEVPAGWEYAGELIESGSGTNGSYTKWEDGTLICTGYVVKHSDDITWRDWYGTLHRSQTFSVNVPAHFVGDYVVATDVLSFGIINVMAVAAHSDHFDYDALAHNQVNDGYNTNIVFKYIAIGKWK